MMYVPKRILLLSWISRPRPVFAGVSNGEYAGMNVPMNIDVR